MVAGFAGAAALAGGGADFDGGVADLAGAPGDGGGGGATKVLIESVFSILYSGKYR